MKDSSRLKGILLVVTGTLLWGVSGVAAQYLFESENFTPEWLVVVRMVIAGALMLIYSAFKGDKNVYKIWANKENIIKILVFALIGMLGVQYTYFAAILHGNAATATILQYLSPVIIIVYLAFCNKKLPSSKEIICILMAILGVFLIITKGNLNTLAISKEAVFWGVLSAITCAIYTLQPAKLLQKYGSLCVVGWGMLIGGLAFGFIYPPFNCSGNFSVKSILAIALVVFFGTLIAYYCYLESLKYIEPSETSMFTCVEPLSASVLSMIFFNVTFSFVQLIGALFIIVTISILSFSKNKDKSKDIKECEPILS